MTPSEFKQARKSLSLSQSEMAIALGLKTSRAIRHYESGDRVISGPISLLIKKLIKEKEWESYERDFFNTFGTYPKRKTTP